MFWAVGLAAGITLGYLAFFALLAALKIDPAYGCTLTAFVTIALILYLKDK